MVRLRSFSLAACLGLVCLAAALPASDGDLDAELAELRFDHWSVADGLSQNTVGAMAFDRDGQLWLGTLDGLNSFDGHRFRVFPADPDDPATLPHGQVYDLCVDADGELWVATRAGLGRLRRETGAFERWSERGKDFATVPSLARTPAGAGGLWLGGVGEVMRIDHRSGEVLFRQSLTGGREAIAADTVNFLEEDAAGQLWVATRTGLFRLREAGKTLERVRLGAGVLEPAVDTLLVDAAGRVWIGTEAAGLFRLDPGGGRRRWLADRDPARGLPANEINQLIEDRQGRLWVATTAGFAVFGPDRETPHKLPRQLRGDDRLRSAAITGLALDPQGALWIGTQNGVHRLRDYHSFRVISRELGSPLANDRVWTMVERQGRLYVGTDGGLDVIELASGALVHHVPFDVAGGGLRNPTVRGLLLDGDMLWIGTDGGGLARLRLRDFALDHPLDGLAGADQVQQLRGLYRDGRGRLWLSLYGLGVGRYDPASGRLEVFPAASAGFASVRPYCFFENGDGTLWVGLLEGGLDLFDPAQGKVIRHYAMAPVQAGPLSNSVTSIGRVVGQRPDRLFLTTLDGVYSLDLASREVTRLAWSWLPNDSVYAIYGDPAGFLWMATNNGLVRYQHASGRVQQFTVVDGLASNEFNGNAHFQSADGRIFLGGPAGLQYFQPEEIVANTFVPPVLVTGVRIFDRRLPGLPANPLKLDHRDRFVTFEYAALNYRQPAKNRYQYRLQGFDADWVDAGTKAETSYGNLSPGRYVFEVRGANNDGVWNPRPATLVVEVAPPWWQSGWALVAYAGLLGAAMMALARHQMARVARERHRLEGKVRARTAELEATVERLRQSEREALAASRAKAEFLANMSHEIRTPLNAVLGMTGLLLGSKLDARQQTFAQTIRTSGNALFALLSDVLDFSRIEAGKVDLEMLPFSVRSCVEESIEMVAPLVGDKPLVVRAAFAAAVPDRVEQDLTRLRQVLVNLLSNAVKFTQRGEITVKVNAEPHGDGRWELRFAVRDTGIGIPADRLPSLFESFTQVDSSTTRRFGGTGLGLAICKRLVEMMSGRLEVESRVGVGSTFRFTILAAIAAEEAGTASQLLSIRGLAAAAELPGTELAKDLRILVAEDNAVNQLVIQAMLEQLGGRGDLAENGREVLEALRRDRYDLILMDVQMPELDGIAATRQIRELFPAERQPHIVALTAGALEADRERCLQAGMDGYLSKPVQIESLAETLRTLKATRPATASRPRGGAIT